jgi:6-phosphogluconolactonase
MAARFDTDKLSFEVLARCGEIENPSFVQVIQSGGHMHLLLVVRESSTQGQCALVQFDSVENRFSLLGPLVSSLGADPCHILHVPAMRGAVISNYSSGGPVFVGISPDEKQLAPASAISFNRPIELGPVSARQEAPHAHCSLLDPSGEMLFVSDLGRDAILVYRVGADLELIEAATIRAPPGSGPRHMTFVVDGRVLLVSCELNSTVLAIECDLTADRFTTIQSISTLPSDAPSDLKSFPSHIAASHDGRFVYVANRGHDSIATFAVGTDAGSLLSLMSHCAVGAWPRHFALSPDGQSMLVAEQHRGTVAAYPMISGVPQQPNPGSILAAPQSACVAFAL